MKKSRKRVQNRNSYTAQRNNDLITRKKTRRLRLSRSRNVKKRIDNVSKKVFKKLEEQINDRRFWHPEGVYRPLRERSGKIAEIRTNKPLQKEIVPERVEFSRPREVIECQRRRKRRQALFAFKKAGKGKGGPKRRVMKWYSQIKC